MRIHRAALFGGRKGVVSTLVMLVILLILVACAPGTPAPRTRISATTPTPTLTPTPAVPGGTVLYHTDWSDGVTGWSVPKSISAQASKGQLHLTCHEQNTMILNYRPRVTNYALEISLQIVSILHNGGTFALVDQQSTGKDGYVGGAASLEQRYPFHGQFNTFLEPFDDSSSYFVADFSPGTMWITYRVEVRDGTLSVYVNGLRHGQVWSNHDNALASGPLGLNCGNAVLNASAVTLTAL